MSTSLPPSLLIHLVQATLFGGMIMVLLLAAPFVSARLRHILGWVGLLKFVLPLGMLGLALPWETPRLLTGGWLPALLVSDATRPVANTMTTSDWIWLTALGLWLAGAIVMAVHMMVRILRMARQLRAHRRPFPAALQQQLSVLAKSVGVEPRCVTGWSTSAQTTPGVSGIFRSRIHIPRELLNSLTPDELEAVLLHELVHIGRRDNLWRMLQTAIVCLCWLHPLVWWLHRRLILESERACDEAVVRLTCKGEAYARGLFKAARYALGLEVPGFAGMARSGLKTRLAAVLKPIKEKDHPMLRLSLILLVGLGFVGTSGAIAADTATQKTEVFDLRSLDQQPIPKFMSKPRYPAEMRAQGITGKVVVEFIVDTNGDVRNCFAARSTRKGFEESAVSAVSKWKFRPGKKDGHWVNTRLQVPIVFSLNDKKK